MNLNVINVVVLGVGAILLYAAVKDQKPQDVVKGALGQKSPQTVAQPSSSTAKATVLPASARNSQTIVSV